MKKISNLNAILILIFLALVVYYNSFNCAFVYDDYVSIIENDYIKDIHNLRLLWALCADRFLTNFSFAVNYHFGGLNTFGYHWVNFIIHILNSVLAYFLVVLIFNTPKVKCLTEGKGNTALPPPKIIAFFVSMIFLAHPLQTQSVTYISQRAEALAMMFYFLTLIFYLKGRILWIEKSRHNFIPVLLIILGLASGGAGTLSKPTIFSLPIMVILFEVFFFSDSIAEFRRNFYFITPFFLLFVPLKIFLVDFGGMRDPAENLLKPSEYLLTQFSVLATYIRLLFLPYNQNLDYDYPVSGGFFQTRTFLSFIFLLLVFMAAVHFFKKNRLISFGILWFFITLSLTSSIFPITDVIYEHRLYGAVFGFAIILVLIFYNLFIFLSLKFNKKGLLKYWHIPLLIYILCFSVATHQRNKVWENPLTVWRDTSKKSPLKARPLNNYGVYLHSCGYSYQAAKQFIKALELNPLSEQSRNNLGVALQSLGNPQDAEKEFKSALDLYPDYYDALSNLGFFYLIQGKHHDARKYLERAIRIKPSNAKLYFLLGDSYRQTGNFTKALKYYKGAISLAPKDPQAYSGIGLVYVEKKLYKQAIYKFQEAIELNPGYSDSYNNMGIALLECGEKEKALEYFRKAIMLNPANYNAYTNIGNIYRESKNFDRAENYYNKALSIKPNFVTAIYNLGLAYEGKGQLEKAIKRYQMIPNHPGAKNRLEILN